MYVLPNDGLSNFQAYLHLNFLLQPSARWGPEGGGRYGWCFLPGLAWHAE